MHAAFASLFKTLRTQDQIDRVLVAAEALHKSIVRPLLEYHSERYRALREVHEPLLKSIETITGKRPPFIQWGTIGRAGAASYGGLASSYGLIARLLIDT